MIFHWNLLLPPQRATVESHRRFHSIARCRFFFYRVIKKLREDERSGHEEEREMKTEDGLVLDFDDFSRRTAREKRENIKKETRNNSDWIWLQTCRYERGEEGNISTKREDAEVVVRRERSLFVNFLIFLLLHSPLQWSCRKLFVQEHQLLMLGRHTTMLLLSLLNMNNFVKLNTWSEESSVFAFMWLDSTGSAEYVERKKWNHEFC